MTLLLDWTAAAACAGHEPQLWDTPTDGDAYQIAYATAVCRDCPVRARCDTDAHANVNNRRGVIRAGTAYDPAGNPVHLHRAATPPTRTAACGNPACHTRFTVTIATRRFCSDLCRYQYRNQARTAA